MTPFVKARPYFLKSQPETQQGWEIDTAHGTFFCCITDQVRIYDEGRLIQLIPVGNLVRQFLREWPTWEEIVPVLESVIRKRLIHFPLFDGQILDGECQCLRRKVRHKRLKNKAICLSCAKQTIDKGGQRIFLGRRY